MLKWLGFALLTLLYIPTYAQNDTATKSATDTAHLKRHLRISLLTYNAGDMIWQKFGHVCLRVIDSNKADDSRDLTYNYGTFDAGEQNFEVKVATGDLLYYLSVIPYNFFSKNIVDPDQGAQEQVFFLSDNEKTALLGYIQNNALFKNKFYNYQFFEDNCCTRIRDIFPRLFGSGFAYGHVLPKYSKLSFRDIIHQYMYSMHWDRVGGSMMLGYHIDKIMTDKDVMFLPDYLRDGVAGATLNGHKFASDIITIEPTPPPYPTGIDWPFMLTLLLAILTVVGFSARRFYIVGRIMGIVLPLLSGLLGCLMLFLWFGSEYKACRDNLNILWALPTNLILPFLKPKIKGYYSVAAIALLGVTVLLQVFKVQTVPLMELIPAFIALLYMYGMFYRNRNSAVAKKG